MNILVLLPLNDRQKQMLEQAAPGCRFTYSSPNRVDADMLGQAQIMIGSPGLDKLRQAQALRWLQLQSAGSDEYVQPGVLPAGTLLSNASGAYGVVISEYMLGGLLSLFKKLHLYRDAQRSASWQKIGEARTIYGATALILGLGDIGGAFAQRVKALGGYTIGVRRTDTRKPDYLDELHLADALDTLLPRADIIALSLPQSPQTHHMLDRRRLALCREDCVILNVGRGTAIDTDALCDALAQGRLAGAALDVTDPEPLPPEHPLWQQPNALITPHISGGWGHTLTLDTIVQISADNLRAYLAGGKLRNLVDFSTGYRRIEP